MAVRLSIGGKYMASTILNVFTTPSLEAEDAGLLISDEDIILTQQQGNSRGSNHLIFHNSSDVSSTLIDALRVCARQKDLVTGISLHVRITESGLLRSVHIGSALVNMYAKCGDLEKAQEAFNELPIRNVVSWNTLIVGYTQHGLGKEALSCLDRMQLGGFPPDAFTFACILKACASMGALNKGEEVYAQIIKGCFLEEDVFVGSALVDMYCKFGALEKAWQVFDELPTRNVVTWNALIAGYAQRGHGLEALKCFEQMKQEGFSPDAVTFTSVLKACGSVQALDKGEEIYAYAKNVGLIRKDVVFSNALIDMYAKCGALHKARELFNELPAPNTISWNALITGYAHHGYAKEALKCFKLMQEEGFSPDDVTFACILKVCASIGGPDRGQEVHAQILREGLLGKDILVANALMDMYAKFGELVRALDVFYEVSIRDLVSWNTLISGYAQNDYGEEALGWFEQLQLEGYFPDTVTFTSMLKACGSIGAACKGQEMHAEIVTKGLVETCSILSTAVVNMYADCGMLLEAQALFDKVPSHDLVLWSTLMVGYAQLGNDIIVFSLHEKMIGESIGPDLASLTILLSSCSHRGLLDRSQFYFEAICDSYDITPSSQHYACMVDLFGRAGCFEEVIAVVEEMPYNADSTMSHALLGACQTWGNAKLANWVFEYATLLDEKDASPYVCMRNLYADVV